MITIEISDDLLNRTVAETGISDHEELLREALEALVERSHKRRTRKVRLRVEIDEDVLEDVKVFTGIEDHVEAVVAGLKMLERPPEWIRPIEGSERFLTLTPIEMLAKMSPAQKRALAMLAEHRFVERGKNGFYPAEREDLRIDTSTLNCLREFGLAALSGEGWQMTIATINGRGLAVARASRLGSCRSDN